MRQSMEAERLIGDTALLLYIWKSAIMKFRW